MKNLFKLTSILAIGSIVSGCASNEVKDPSKAYITWHAQAQKANLAGVDIIKINGSRVSAEKNGFGSWSHRVALPEGKYEVEYKCNTLHPFSKQIHNTAGRLTAQNRGGLYKKIDYGFGKTTIEVKKGETYFFQAKYENLYLKPKEGVGSFTGKCQLAQANTMSFLDAFQSNLKNLK